MKILNGFAIFGLGLVSLQPQAIASSEVDATMKESAFEADFAVETPETDHVEIDEIRMSATHADLMRAKVVAVINKSSIGSDAQTVKVYVDGRLIHTFKTSTGREKSEVTKSGRSTRTTTPIGYFRPYSVERNHWSNAWKANMPYTVFFNGGIALHATSLNHYAELGKRASGGCARLELENAKIFYELVKSVGSKPVIQIDRNGKNVLDQKGSPVMINAYDVLIIVENRI